MAIAGGPEARLADPHARENPGIPFPHVASPRMSQTLHPRRATLSRPFLSLSLFLAPFLPVHTNTWIYTQFNRSSPLAAATSVFLFLRILHRRQYFMDVHVVKIL